MFASGRQGGPLPIARPVRSARRPKAIHGDSGLQLRRRSVRERFPAVRSAAPTGPLPPGAKASAGVSEVVVYTDRHEGSFVRCRLTGWTRWSNLGGRYRDLGRRPM